LGETMAELDNMRAEKASELGRVSAIHAELIKKEKASD